MYDIIGDIHGYAEPLKDLLIKLDYTETNGEWHQHGRKVIFVGDYIDRGPAIRETLQIVKAMVDSGNAIALLGNHEYNALGFHTKIDGIPLRKHNEKNIRQHQSTLAQFWDYQEELKMYLEWFYTLPLFFEDTGIRVVHACWDEDRIQWLKDYNKQKPGESKNVQTSYVTLDKNILIESYNKKTVACKVIEETLKGKEFDIPPQYAWADKDGQKRESNRIKWWVDIFANAYGNWLFNCPDEMKEMEIENITRPYVYPADAPPVFIGHYWLEDKFPVIQEKNVVCLDYSIANGGSLVGYKWNGEKQMDSNNFVWVD